MRERLYSILAWLRRSDAEPPERRMLTVNQMLALGAIALVVAGLLSAQWLRKNAQVQDPGITRDVGLALARPLADVSGFLRTDRPRVGAQALIGRSGEDDTDTTVEFAETPRARDTPAERARARPPRKPVFTRRKPLRVWVIGDSLAITPGQSILRVVEANPAMRSVGSVDGRVATGLERPDVFNWFTHIRKQLAKRRPDLTVVTFGANDDHGYMTGLRGGVDIDRFDGPAWRGEYHRRVAGVMDDLTRGGRFVAWIGPPVTRDGEQTKRFRALARIYRQEARARARVVFVDTQALLTRPGKGYEEYLPNAGGRLVKVRAGDGVHFLRAGGDRVARAVFQGVRPLIVLRTAPQPTAGQRPKQSLPQAGPGS